MRELPIHGRGARGNPANRFESLETVPGPGPPDDSGPETRFLRDRSRSVISTNRSPDVPFDASLNPYRGCEHGCIYCYARPTHEFLGFSAGLDFESRILVKENAPALLREELADPGWTPRVLALSGVTDPYQPVERRMEVTRDCLAVLAEARNPVSIVTKSRLVCRDLDLLTRLARHDSVRVTLSVTTLDEELRRIMEPRAPTAEARLDAIRQLSDAGVPVGVNVAPVIPGLTDEEIPRILERAAEAGASHAGTVLLRLPHGVEDLFLDWLDEHFPERKSKVLGRIRDARNGRLNDPRFGTRMRGQGALAGQIRDLFRVSRGRFGLEGRGEGLSTESFRRPQRPGSQIDLFA